MTEGSYYNVAIGGVFNPQSTGSAAFQQATATPSNAVPTAVQGQPGTAGAKYYYGGSMVASAPLNRQAPVVAVPSPAPSQATASQTPEVYKVTETATGTTYTPIYSEGKAGQAMVYNPNPLSGQSFWTPAEGSVAGALTVPRGYHTTGGEYQLSYNPTNPTWGETFTGQKLIPTPSVTYYGPSFPAGGIAGGSAEAGRRGLLGGYAGVGEINKPFFKFSEDWLPVSKSGQILFPSKTTTIEKAPASDVFGTPEKKGGDTFTSLFGGFKPNIQFAGISIPAGYEISSIQGRLPIESDFLLGSAQATKGANYGSIFQSDIKESGWVKQPSRFGASMTSTGTYKVIDTDLSKTYPSGIITAVGPYKFSVLPESRTDVFSRLVQFESRGEVMRNVGDILGHTTFSTEAFKEVVIGVPVGVALSIPSKIQFGYAISTKPIETLRGQAEFYTSGKFLKLTPFEFGMALGDIGAGEFVFGKVMEWAAPKLERLGALKPSVESMQYSAVVKELPAIKAMEVAPSFYNLGDYEVTGVQYESAVEGPVLSRTSLSIFGKEIGIPFTTQEYSLSGYQVMQHLNEPIDEFFNLQAMTTGTLRRGTFISEFAEYSKGAGVTIEAIPEISERGISPYSITLGGQTPTPLIEVGEYTRTLSLEPTTSGMVQFKGKYTLGLAKSPLEYTQTELGFLSKNQPTFLKMAEITKVTGAETGAVWREGELASFDIGMEGEMRGEYSTLVGQGIEVHTHPLRSELSILPSAGDILGGTRSGYIVTEGGVTRFRATGEILYSPFEELKNIKVTETFPETIIPKGQKWLATASISETLKMPVTETYGAMLETGRTSTPFGEISEFTSWGKTETGTSTTQLTVVDFLTKSGEAPSASIISKGGGYEYIPTGGRQVQIQAMKTTQFVSPEVTLQNLGDVVATMGLGYALLGIVPSQKALTSQKASAAQVAFPKQSYNVPTLSATAQVEKVVPSITQATITKTFSPQAYVQQQVVMTTPKTSFVTPNINPGGMARTLNLTRTIDLSKTMDLTKTVDMTKALDLSKTMDLTKTLEMTGQVELTKDLSKTMDLTKTLEMTGQVELTKTTTVEIQQTSSVTLPWMPPTFPPFGSGGGIANVLNVPKSKVFGIGKPKYGRGGPLPLADIASVGITQFKFGAMHSVHQLPLNERTLTKWKKAAGMGFGRGFPTLETEHKNVSKFPKMSIFGKKKKKRGSRR